MKNTEPSKDTLHELLTDQSRSSLQRYQDLAVGSSSIWYLIKYELINLFSSWVPGALGLMLRKLLYPRLLCEVGSNVIFGRGVVIRHGLKIKIADNVVIDDGVVLDAKGACNNGINIGANTIVSRNAVLSCKNGDITIGSGCAVGIYCLVHATQGSNVSIGDDVLIGAFSYFIGGGPYRADELELPFKKQGTDSQGGISVAENVWFGSNVQILDGVSIGTGAIVGTSTVVNKSVEPYCVVAGVPMKLIKSRKSS
ncbi:MAG: acyltransferase [Arenicella sp.]|nr:acyltransferase [Arenicella sp.]